MSEGSGQHTGPSAPGGGAGGPSRRAVDTFFRLYPGVLVALTVAIAATFLSEHYGAPVMLFALLIGMAFHFLAERAPCQQGIEFSAQTVLRWGVALLGLRITLADLARLGGGPVIAVIGLVAATIIAGIVLAWLLGRRWRFGVLTGGAVAICGASAALALASVLPKSAQGERDTLFTVVAVTTLSTIAMILYPILFSVLQMGDVGSGLLVGATIHDVAQVVGAGYAISETAGDTATYVKLLRVTLLPVVLLVLVAAMNAARVQSDSGAGGLRLPWFVLVFAGLLAINSTGVIPAPVVEAFQGLARWLLVTAIAALGVKTSLQSLMEVGGRHIAVVVLETLFLLVGALFIIPMTFDIG